MQLIELHIFMNNDKYLWLKRKAPKDRKSEGFLTEFYDKHVTPARIFGPLFLFVGLLWAQFAFEGQKLLAGEKDSGVFIGLVLVNMFVGFRLTHSVILAKRDYGSLKSYGIWDMFIFFFFLFFTAGIFHRILLAFEFEMKTNNLAIFIFYTSCAFVGAINHYYLAKDRIDINSDHFDHPIEYRIQMVNTYICIFYVVLCGSGALLISYDVFQYDLLVTIMVLICIAACINIEHSQKLTFRPKILLENDCDLTPNIIMEFRKQFSHIDSFKKRSNAEILGTFLDNHQDPHQIRIIRSNEDDVKRIANYLIQNFGYYFAYLLNKDMEKTQDKKETMVFVERLLTTSWGFGPLGFMNFFFIVNKKEDLIGFFKISTIRKESFIYRLWGLSIPLFLIYRYGFTNFFQINMRAKILMHNQNLFFTTNALNIDYLVIFENFRHKGYGHVLLELLIKAYLKENTEDLNFDQIRLTTRSNNTAAIQLFQKIGFKKEKRKHYSIKPDPLKNLTFLGKKVGDPINMIFKRDFLESPDPP